MADADYAVTDLGGERLLVVDGREYRTRYSEGLLRLLIERKGARRAALYMDFKETRGRLLAPLFAYLGAEGRRALSVLEVGCSFGHLTEFLNDQDLVAEIVSFDVDPAFAAMTRLKAAELPLAKVGEVLHLDDEGSRSLPFPDGRFDLVMVVGVIEHLPWRDRHRYVDEYYRVLAPGGHIAVLDTPNRAFPFETHTVGLPGVQWLPAAWAFRYVRALGPARLRAVPLEEFTASAWRNASLAQCLPSRGRADLRDVTEAAGYGWEFFRGTAESRARRAALPAFAAARAALRVVGRSPSLALPYLNLVLRKEPGTGERRGTTRRSPAR